ncbi:hypothetical protein ACHHYP_02091 [Achlya hypogyna]|uniref:PHD-type domain-containing protein n=1 Tax=Achlya hypogyna TaxID=1202772 RepID=A0A1V9Z7D0_ACHHY|nr:hypothetical protein ACHHYP_02091 [Achlya hypogyna]
MLKLGRGLMQMQYEPCETCGKSRVVALESTAVPVAQGGDRPTERLISDMCRCKRRRATPKPIDTGPSPSTDRRRPPASYDPDDEEEDDEEEDDDEDDDDYGPHERNTRSAAPSTGTFVPRCLRIRLRKVDDGYEAVPPEVPISVPARAPLVVRLHRIGDGEYVALDNSQPQPARKRRLSFQSGESDSSDGGTSSGAESTPSTPSSPVRKPHPEAAIPVGLSLADLPVAPWEERAPGTANRLQCEVCGKGGRLACCERCPAVYHGDCLPLDHPVDGVDPWWCPRCLQTPIGQQTKACRLCSSDSNLSQIILCDCCDDEYHLYCLSPPLTEVPSGDWFCPFCRSHNHVKRQCIKKKRKGRKKKRPLQFYYPSLLQETYEDLSILGRCRKFQPPAYGKLWTADDDRKLGNHQRKVRSYRDKVTARNMVKPDWSKADLAANAPYLQDIIVDDKGITGMFHMLDTAAARLHTHDATTLATRAEDVARWRREWHRSTPATDVYMRLVAGAFDCSRLLLPWTRNPPVQRQSTPTLPTYTRTAAAAKVDCT